MTGWLKRVSGSGGVEENFNSLQKSDSYFDFESENNSDEKLKRLFNQFLDVFLKEFTDISNFRPLPPVIDEGQEVDLFKLYTVVRKRGGGLDFSRNVFLWSCVAKDCGFDSRLGPSLKLVYFKYLDTLVRWLANIAEDKEERITRIRENSVNFNTLWMGLESNFKEIKSENMKKEGSYVEVKKNALDSETERKAVGLRADVKNVDEILKAENRGVNVKNEDTIIRKRKRGCCTNMLNWINMVAKDPCNPVFGSLPERHKWKHYGSELQWKQILLVRESMLLKRNVDASSHQSIWQIKQKMHPSMYDDQPGSEKLRFSRRLITAKDSSSKPRERNESSSSGLQTDEQSDSTADSVIFCAKRKKIPMGPPFQADLPEFCKTHYEPDSKWLGTQIWPLDKKEQIRSLIERDPIGKGRRESCGCQFPGSPECFRFHISEKRTKVKLELGSAFYKWKFDSKGEEVALTWTEEDEKKFQNIVMSNRLSSDKYFWEELFKFFPKRGREGLVSYYFNVFLLRRRCFQNRDGTGKIDSDNEEAEFGPIGNRFGQVGGISPGSIFCSPKKSNSKNT